MKHQHYTALRRWTSQHYPPVPSSSSTLSNTPPSIHPPTAHCASRTTQLLLVLGCFCLAASPSPPPHFALTRFGAFHGRDLLLLLPSAAPYRTAPHRRIPSASRPVRRHLTSRDSLVPFWSLRLIASSRLVLLAYLGLGLQG